jgi:hypothetical protein
MTDDDIKNLHSVCNSRIEELAWQRDAAREALKALWPFLEEDKALVITPGYLQSIQKAEDVLKSF